MEKYVFINKVGSFFLFLLVLGVILFIASTKYSFADQSFQSTPGGNKYQCNDPNNNTPGDSISKKTCATGLSFVCAWAGYTYCAKNEKCVDSNRSDENNNVATCTAIDSSSKITKFTCHSNNGMSPNNGMDAQLANGQTITNYKYCPSNEKCVNDSSGTATCQAGSCTCDPGDSPSGGAGKNTMTCDNGSGGTFSTACSALQACTGSAGHATCTQLQCTCDHPNDSSPGNNGFTCGSNHDFCQSTEVCTGAARKATCTYSSQAGNANISYPTPPCGNPTPIAAGTGQGGCSSVNTAFGTWSTDPSQFVRSMMGIIMSIAGGIAVLLIIAAGYSMVMSQGDPEKIQAAKERLTSAIIGLLFLIFSVVILQVIGINILHLPCWGTGTTVSGNCK